MAAPEHFSPIRAWTHSRTGVSQPAGGHLYEAAFAQGVPRLVRRRLRRSNDPGAPALARAVQAITGRGIEPAEADWIERIEAARAEFALRPGRIAGLAPSPGESRSFPPAHLANVSSIHRPWGAFLMRLVRELRPQSCVELGAAIGISASYQGAGLELNGTGVLRSIEGSPNLAAEARATLSGLGLERVQVIEGRLDDVLDDVMAGAAPVDLVFLDAAKGKEGNLALAEGVLPHLAPRATLVMDDVHWSRQMNRAWRQLRSHPRIALSADLWRLGVCLLQPR
jgi:predicted O-methyltransferase YrrM